MFRAEKSRGTKITVEVVVNPCRNLHHIWGKMLAVLSIKECATSSSVHGDTLEQTQLLVFSRSWGSCIVLSPRQFGGMAVE